MELMRLFFIAIVVFEISEAALFAVKYLSSNKKLKFDPARRQKEEELLREDEIFERTLKEMVKDSHSKYKAYRCRECGPFNGANLKRLFQLLNVSSVTEAKVALQEENYKKLSPDIKLNVQWELMYRTSADMPLEQVFTTVEETKKRAKEIDERIETMYNNIVREGRAKVAKPQPKHIYCFYNAHHIKDRGYILERDMPLDVCTSVVYCCVGVSRTYLGLLFYNNTIDLHPKIGLRNFFDYFTNKTSITTHVAVGGPDTDYAALSYSVKLDKMEEFAVSIYNWFNRYTPQSTNIVWYLPEPYRLQSILDYHYFCRLIFKDLVKRKERNLTTIIPSSVETVSIFNYAMKSHHVILLEGLEVLDDPNEPQCPVSFEPFHNLHYSPSGNPYIIQSIIAGFVLKGYSYNVSASPPTLSLAGYDDICTALAETINSKGECLVLDATSGWQSAASPETFNKTWKKLNFNVKGIAVMDPEWDDFRNKCGNGPSPILKAIKHALWNSQ